MDCFYKTPQAFDRALKKAIAKSGAENRGERYRQMLRDRFLCRVFYLEGDEFILKGGSGLLARIPNARSTRDIDFGHKGENDTGRVLERLNAAAAYDLGDWCRFELTRREESFDSNGYSRLLKLRYSTHIGEEEKDPVLIDVSLDGTTTIKPDRVEPLNRVQLDGIITCDYLVYSLPDQLADKLCAIMEKQPDGWPSSRMKDLMDVVTYAKNEYFDIAELALAIQNECMRRNMTVPKSFSAPEFWRQQYADFAKRQSGETQITSFDDSINLASKFFNPPLNRPIKKMIWNPDNLNWEPKE